MQRGAKTFQPLDSSMKESETSGRGWGLPSVNQEKTIAPAPQSCQVITNYFLKLIVCLLVFFCVFFKLFCCLSLQHQPYHRRGPSRWWSGWRLMLHPLPRWWTICLPQQYTGQNGWGRTAPLQYRTFWRSSLDSSAQAWYVPQRQKQKSSREISIFIHSTLQYKVRCTTFFLQSEYNLKEITLPSSPYIHSYWPAQFVSHAGAHLTVCTK